jgi:hypothetical protein
VDYDGIFSPLRVCLALLSQHRLPKILLFLLKIIIFDVFGPF